MEATWQRALALASQAAKSDDNAARERLEQIRIENDVRAQSFELRETEFETAARERERALIEGRSQLNALMSELASNRATMRAQVARIMDLGVQVEDYRRQLATLIERAVTRNRTLAERKTRPANRPMPRSKPKRRVTPKKSVRRARPKGRSKR